MDTLHLDDVYSYAFLPAYSFTLGDFGPLLNGNSGVDGAFSVSVNISETDLLNAFSSAISRILDVLFLLFLLFLPLRYVHKGP